MYPTKFVILSCLAACLIGCTAPTIPHLIDKPSNVYLDQHFAEGPELETAEQIFYISETMKRYVQLRLRPKKDVQSKTKQMISDFFDPNQLDINYVSNANLTASEAFEQGIANCLSLTVLSYVLAKEAQLNASFMDVSVPENWTYSNGIRMLNGHVNLRISAPVNPTLIVQYERQYTIDFLPMLNGTPTKSTTLSKSDIIALFYNNKGADALVINDEDTAYHYFKQATIISPHLSEAWGNLASLYTRKGFVNETERILQYASKIAPNNLNIKESLAHMYRNYGQQDKANALSREINAIRNTNPYYHAMLGRSALDKGQYNTSISHYKDAMKLDDRNHQFLFGLAQNYLMLGQHQRANKYLERARVLANDFDDQKKYDSKIYALQKLARR